MSEFPGDPALCGSRHPSEPITCRLAPGPNAVVDIAPEIDPTATAEEVDAVLSVPPKQRKVHVHKGLDRDGGTHRWEDPPEEFSE